MVTKSLLDKILSKTVKRNELNALSLSKKDRDRIYDNIVNGEGGSSNDNASFYDLFDIVGVYLENAAPYNFVIASSSGQLLVNDTLKSFNNIKSPASLISDYKSTFDFDKNYINIGDKKSLIKKSSFTVANSIITSEYTNGIMIIPKNCKMYSIDTYTNVVDYDYITTNVLNELANNNDIIFNPKLSLDDMNEICKHIFNTYDGEW